MIVYNEQTTPNATEYGMAGVFLDNANPVSPYQNGSSGGPLAWKYSGDGWTSSDLAIFREGTPTSSGYVSRGSYDSIPANSIPGFRTGMTSSRGPAPPDTHPKGSWVKVRIESTGSTVKWLLNGTLVDAYDNTAGHYTAGNILIGCSDPFNTVGPQPTGVIVDNVVVGVPEPIGLIPAIVMELAVIALARSRHAPRPGQAPNRKAAASDSGACSLSVVARCQSVQRRHVHRFAYRRYGAIGKEDRYVTGMCRQQRIVGAMVVLDSGQ
jgi:hypothetical protein